MDFDLPSWGKLQMALAGGSQQMNVLAVLPLSPPQGSGGTAIPPSPLQPGSTVTELVLTPDQLANYNVGDIVAVDSDYTGATGYVGAGAPAAYLSSPLEPEHSIGLHPPRDLQRLARFGAKRQPRCSWRSR